MSVLESVIELHDLDQLLALVEDVPARARWRRMGLAFGEADELRRERTRRLESLDRHWRLHYERGLERYGAGLTRVRGRVCQGCFVTLPTSQAPPSGLAQLHLCQGCGRLLLWA